MASQRSIERRKRIIAIRDKALALIAAHGKPERVRNAPGDYLAAKLGPFDVSLMSPLAGLEPTARQMEVFAERGTLPAEYVHHLNIWQPKGKVMFLAWVASMEEEFEVVSFRRGDWEEQFLGLERV